MAYRLPPDANLIDWIEGETVGVIGGIAKFRPGGAAERTHLVDVTSYGADPTGVADCTSAVAAAVAASVSEDVIYFPPGIYNLPTGYGFPVGGGLTVRGAGMGITKLKIGSKLVFGSDSNTPLHSPNIVAGLEKGSTSITVDDASGFSAGKIIIIQVSNRVTPGNRVISGGGGSNLQTQTNYISGPPTGNVIPLLYPIYDDLTGRDSAVANLMHQTSYNSGIEKLTVDCQNISQVGVEFATTICCWAYEVEALSAINYGLKLTQTVAGEFRRCVSHDVVTPGGSNHGGMLLGWACASLIVDNWIENYFPAIEVNFGSSGNCIVANAGRETLGASCISHGPHNTHNYIAHNTFPLISHSDGYHGSESLMTIMRNFCTGEYTSGNFGTSIANCRFTRGAFVAGNLLGTPGHNNGSESIGNPNIGDGHSSGVQSELATNGTLSTRTSASAGTITGPSGHTVTTGSVISIAWVNLVVGTGDRIVSYRTKVQVGTVSGTSIPISGGDGFPLPSQDAEVWIPNTNPALRRPWADVDTFPGTGPIGYEEQDLDVFFSSIFLVNVGVDDSGGSAQIVGQSLEVGETLPDCLLWGSKPALFGTKDFPPFRYEDPVFDIRQLPAAVRFLDGVDPAEDPEAPAFTVQPTTQAVDEGDDVTLIASASGNPAPTYQWQKDGEDIDGETSSSLTITDFSADDAGDYTCDAHNSEGDATSDTATLTLSVPPVAASIGFTLGRRGGGLGLLFCLALMMLSGCSFLPHIRLGKDVVTGPKDAGTPATLSSGEGKTTIPLPANTRVTVTKRDYIPATTETPAQPASETTQFDFTQPTTFEKTEVQKQASTGTIDTTVAKARVEAEERRWLLWAAIACGIGGIFLKSLMPAWPGISNGLLIAAAVAGVAWKVAALPSWVWLIPVALMGAKALGYKRAEWDANNDGIPDIIQKK